MKSTKAQIWARKRNWQKGQLISTKHILTNPIYTFNEKRSLKIIAGIIDGILLHWEKNNQESKETYLK